MKSNVYKKLLYLVCGVMTLGTAFTACHLEPYEIPAEELYLRNFIKKYGLIDPSQDWNMSMPTEITVVPDKPIAKLNLLVECNGEIFRVAEYADVTETVNVPVDVPDGTKRILVDADGETQYVEIGGTANFAKTKSRASRALITPTWESSTNRSSYGFPYWPVDSNYINCVGHGWGENLRLGDAQYDDDNNFLRFADVYTVGSTKAPQPGNEGDHARLVLSVHNNTKQMYRLSFKTGLLDGEANLQVFIIKRWEGTPYVATEVKITSTEGWTPTQEHVIITPSLPEGDYQVIVYAENTTQVWGFAGNWGYFNFEPFEYRNMAWLMVAEDLGATDDFDFNDIILRIEAITVNTSIYNQQWQVVTDDSQHPVLGRETSGSRAGESTFKRLRVTALCAGGTLPLYLHYNEGNKDYIISKVAGIKHEVPITDTSDSYSQHEWHRWFGIADHRIMINTGVSKDGTVTSTRVTDHFQPVEFYVGAEFTMNKYSKFVDYDGDLANLTPDEAVNESWNWATSPVDYKIEGFYITVGGATLAKCRTALYQPRKGEAPQAFLIPDVGFRTYGWEWPTERTNISVVYPYFLEWAHVGGDTDNPNALYWYTKGETGIEADLDYCSRQ